MPSAARQADFRYCGGSASTICSASASIFSSGAPGSMENCAPDQGFPTATQSSLFSLACGRRIRRGGRARRCGPGPANQHDETGEISYISKTGSLLRSVSTSNMTRRPMWLEASGYPFEAALYAAEMRHAANLWYVRQTARRPSGMVRTIFSGKKSPSCGERLPMMEKLARGYM